MARLIDSIKNPDDLKKLKLTELPMVALEIREEMTKTVSKTGGHLASSLGAVELTIAIHYVFDTPKDSVMWDVGHQSYAHKILTGRLGRFHTLRQLGGLSGFPNKDESPEYDLFTCGHASTSISTALGLAFGRDLRGEADKILAVIGDASLGGGMAFEALNHAGQTKKDLIIILNDNELSISRSVGALSRYLNRIITNPAYNKIRRDVERVLKRIPRFGFRAYRAARKLEEGLKNLLIPGMLFEEMGFRYFGPIDGHNIAQLVATFRNILDLKEPLLLHVVTKKGKGYRFAEERPADFHGTGPFDPATGIKAPKAGAATFTDVLGEKLIVLAQRDRRIIAVTAAMLDGTGLGRFAALFPERFVDVGIAEEHAVGLAAGMARRGYRPVIAIYSTFMQRGYDQLIHDICLQGLPVVFCLDRAGLAGEDGPTHHGVFDIAFMRTMPGLISMAPRDTDELGKMLEFALGQDVPVAIRYPKGAPRPIETSDQAIRAGKAQILKEGGDVAIISVGDMAQIALEASELLSKKGVKAMVIDARFIKPLDRELLKVICADIKKVVTVEEGVLEGGFGSAVLEFIEKNGISGVSVARMGLPDKFIEHGTRSELLTKYNLTPEAICDVIVNRTPDIIWQR